MNEMTILLLTILVALVSIIIVKDARKHTPSSGITSRKIPVEEPLRPGEVMVPLPVRKPGTSYTPRRGDTVMHRGIESNGVSIHPGIITRTFPGMLVNIMLLPDGAMPLPVMHVALFRDDLEAAEYLASVAPAKATAAWPTRTNDAESLK